MSKLENRTNRKAAGAVRGLAIPARRIAVALVAVILLSGAAVAWSAAAANAGTGHAASSAAKIVRPDDLTVTLLFLGGSKSSYDCVAGKTYSVNKVVTEVENSCKWRVWLHPYTFCTSPVRAGYPPEHKYANVQVSDNTNNCTVP